MEKSKRSFLPWGMVSTILTLAWPTMLEELMQTAVQYIDTAMVGAIGTQATAAVGGESLVSGGAGGSGLRHVFYCADAGAEQQGAGVDAG